MCVIPELGPRPPSGGFVWLYAWCMRAPLLISAGPVCATVSAWVHVFICWFTYWFGLCYRAILALVLGFMNSACALRNISLAITFQAGPCVFFARCASSRSPQEVKNMRCGPHAAMMPPGQMTMAFGRWLREAVQLYSPARNLQTMRHLCIQARAPHVRMCSLMRGASFSFAGQLQLAASNRSVLKHTLCEIAPAA